MPKTSSKRSSASLSKDQKDLPSKKAKTSKKEKQPSELIDDVSAQLSFEDFRALLRTHVYPLVDALPSSKSSDVVAAFKEKQESESARTALLDVINLEGHEKSLSALQKKLNKCVQRNWKDTNDTDHYMELITQEICAWLDALFPIAIEQKVHLDEVFQALKCALKMLDKLDDTNAYVPFRDLYEDIDFTLKNGSGEVVYRSSSIYDIFWKFHRDLLCIAAITGNESLVKEIVRSVKERKDRRSTVLDVVRENGWAISDDEDEVNQYQDAWYPEDMKG